MKYEIIYTEHYALIVSDEKDFEAIESVICILGVRQLLK
jgi:hypothetical protein